MENDEAADGCIFCDIVAGRIAADTVYAGDNSLFFRDIAPKALVHIVGVTKKHMASLAEAQSGDAGILGQLLVDAAKVAREQGLTESGYRVITNVGADAGQTVSHLHVHILGGEMLGPLRC